MVCTRYFNGILMQKTNYYRLAIGRFPLDAVLIGRLYDGVVQKKLRRFKFVHNTVDSVYFRSIFAELVEESGIKNMPHNSVIVYPPISLKDRILRWPNHAKRLAKIFSDLLWAESLVCPFHKSFFAGHQSQRNKSQRKQIISEYRLKRHTPYTLEGKEVIIIDDIITTGYTMFALGNLLKTLWVKKITWFFLASHKI
jgi:predicted amidophosphoribosyltransferase